MLNTTVFFQLDLITYDVKFTLSTVRGFLFEFYQKSIYCFNIRVSMYSMLNVNTYMKMHRLL